MTAQPHDALFRDTFSDLACAGGELVGVVPPDVVALVDWSALRLEPGSLASRPRPHPS